MRILTSNCDKRQVLLNHIILPVKEGRQEVQLPHNVVFLGMHVEYSIAHITYSSVQNFDTIADTTVTLELVAFPDKLILQAEPYEQLDFLALDSGYSLFRWRI